MKFIMLCIAIGFIAILGYIFRNNIKSAFTSLIDFIKSIFKK